MQKEGGIVREGKISEGEDVQGKMSGSPRVEP